MNIEKARSWARAQLTEQVEADYLLSALLNKPRSFLFAFPEYTLDKPQLAKFTSWIKRRQQGEPVAYIVGVKEFWSLSLAVSPSTLIPRPESELLVELALEKIHKEKATVCDLGTGTGAIALAIASERPHWEIVGVDRIPEAVSLANQNAKRLGLTHVEFCHSNWFEALDGRSFDIIVANPPYVEENSPYLQQGDLCFEPTSALTAGEDGLSDIRKIIDQASAYLNAKGWLMIEHGFEQHHIIAKLLKKADFIDIQAVADLNHIQRVSLARRET